MPQRGPRWALPFRWVQHPRRRGAGRAGGATALFHYVVPANPTTVALSYLVVILLAATEWGLVEATVLAAAASLGYNFFFLPPVGR